MKNPDTSIQGTKDAIEQQPLPLSVTLHLLPGLLILLFYVATVPLVTEWGFPASFATLLGFLFIGIPFELGFLYYQGYKKNEKLSLKGIVRYRERIPFWQYPIIVIILILYAVLVSYLMSPVGAYLRDSILSFLPAWFLNPSQGEPGETTFFVYLAARFLVDGLANPIVEETYFRGYLLPRISRLGVWAPLLNAMLFSLAHFWQPANVPQIFLLVTPLYYLVWWKRNIYISMAVHCTANLIGVIVAVTSS